MQKPKSQVVFFIWAVTALALRLSASSMEGAPAFSLGAKELLELASKGAGTTTSPAVILMDDEHWSFSNDKTVECKQHVVFKLLDQSAVQAWSSIQERWEPWHQDRPKIRARVVTADGAEHELDSKTLSDAPAGSNMPQSYSDVRVLQGPLPAIGAGAVVEYEITERQTPALGSIALRRYVASTVPVRFARFSADYPETLPFRYTVELCPTLQSTEKTQDGMVHLVLSLGGFDPVTQVDPLLPFNIPRVASVNFSTGASWNQIAIDYGAVVDKQIAGAPVQKLVSEALAGENERPAIIQKLVGVLNSQVRYTGIEFADAAIVPAKPAETLMRKYGDCKDKASLLVAMLRAAGVPAYVALLNAGLDQDIAPGEPGMGMFNHAMVYVPGSPEFWIDATAEHLRAGALLPGDEGRLALIVRPETKGLTKVPEEASAEATSTSEFEYTLPEFGASHVTVTLSGSGVFDSTYRDMAALLDNAEVRQQAEKQMQAEWNTKAPIKNSHSQLSESSKPFQFVSDIPDAKKVTVSAAGATLTLPIQSVFAALPTFFATDSSGGDTVEKKKPRTEGFVIPMAFIGKMICRVHLTAGLVLKKIPEDQALRLGPAVYTAHFTLKNDVFIADIAFDSKKREYTLEEGEALQKATIDFLKQPVPSLSFEPVGQSFLAEGKLREGLDVFREIAAKPDAKAINHIRLSRAYLQAGCGPEARNEAKMAEQMAPDLAMTWRNLAFIYEHDLIGRQFKEGWDPATVETALRKAMTLDADDLSANVELAESFSYDLNGNRYQSMERLAKAIDVFRALGDDKVEQQEAQDTMIYELGVLGNLSEMKGKLDRFGSNGSRAGYLVFLNAVQDGITKAAADLRASASGDELKQAFFTAAGLFARTGRYEIEADLASALNIQIFISPSILRTVRRIDPSTLPLDSPEAVVKAFYAEENGPGETAKSLSRFWASSASDRLPAILERWRQATLSGLSQHEILPAVARDVMLSSLKTTTDENQNDGYRVRITAAGRANSNYVVRETGTFKLLGTTEITDGVARRVLTDLDHRQVESARKWLDWLREEIKIRSEDDPLGGPIFPRLWSKGAAASDEQIRYAAASLLRTRESLPILQEAIGATSDATIKNYYRLAYTRACIAVRAWSDCVPVAKALVAAYPESDTALGVAADALAGNGQMEAAEAILDKVIKGSPDNLTLKRSLANALILGKRMTEAESVEKEIAEAPNATVVDWNQYGWLSLFCGDTNDAMIHAVERAQNQPNPNTANTIAAMYAEANKPNEARQLSLQTLDKFAYQGLDSAWWYICGRISEQLGAKLSADSFYENVKLGPEEDASLSAYSLAQKQLTVIRPAPTPNR